MIKARKASTKYNVVLLKGCAQASLILKREEIIGNTSTINGATVKHLLGGF